MKGTVRSADPFFIEVESVLSPESTSSDIHAGDHLGGDVSTGFPCFAPNVPPLPMPDQTVFATYRLEEPLWMKTCDAGAACASVRDERLLAGTLFVALWEDALDVGANAPVPPETLGSLASDCVSRADDLVPSIPSGSDVQSDGDGCAVAKSPLRKSRFGAALAAFVVALGCWRRRDRRKTPRADRGRRRWSPATGVAALALAGCGSSGQTGSAGCAVPASDCICPLVEGKVLVRGTVLEGAPFSMAVDSVLSPSTTAQGIRAEDVLGGAATADGPCDAAAGAEPIPAPGQTAFAAYELGDPMWYEGCSAWQHCAAACIGQVPCDSECRSSTDAACASAREQALLSGKLFVKPWQEPIVFGYSASFPTKDLGSLSSDCAASVEAVDPSKPCQDIVRGSDGGCAVAANPACARSRSVALPALVGLWLLRRRHRRNARR